MVQVEDPAARDQDHQVGRRGRFEERIRRTWNQIPTAQIASAPDLEALAEQIAKLSGEEPHSVYERLRWFQALEDEGPPPEQDRMVRPGAPADAPPPRVRRP